MHPPRFALRREAGVEAAAFIAAGTPVDVMLLDIRMPGMHGTQVMELASPPPPYPVFAMTGHVDAEAQAEFRCVELVVGDQYGPAASCIVRCIAQRSQCGALQRSTVQSVRSSAAQHSAVSAVQRDAVRCGALGRRPSNFVAGAVWPPLCVATPQGAVLPGVPWEALHQGRPEQSIGE
jgi:CheY-like chemotaxis protein